MNKDNDHMKVSRAVAYDNLEAVEKYLEEMAGKGWMLKNVTGATQFNFEKCEPKKLRFAVEIFSEGSIYDTYTIESNQEYIEYCQKAGWNFICSSGKLDYFYTEDDNAPEIETDPAMKLKAIEKAQFTLKILFPLIFIGMGAFNLGIQLTNGLNALEASVFHFSAAMLWVFVGGLYVVMLITYLLWRAKARAAVAKGDRIPPNKANLSFKGGYTLLAVFGITQTVIMLVVGFKYDEKEVLTIPIIWVFIILMIIAGNALARFAEREKFSRGAYKLISIIMIPVISSIVLIGVIFTVVMIAGSNTGSEQRMDAKDMEVFGDSDVFVRREGSDTHWGHFLLSYDRYSLTAYDEEAAEGLEENGIMTIDEENGIITLDAGITQSWEFDIYKPKIRTIYERLMDEARKGTYRMLSISFDFDNAVHVPEYENGGLLTVLNDKGNYEDGLQKYLIYDESTIICLSCNEELSAEQMKVIEKSFMQ